MDQGLIEPTPVWSIHLNRMPRAPESWHHPECEPTIERLRRLRSLVTGALERAREEKKIGDNLQTAPIVILGPDWHHLPTEDFAMWCVTSDIQIIQVAYSFEQGADVQAGYTIVEKDMAIQVMQAEGIKCQRCWRWSHAVKPIPADMSTDMAPSDPADSVLLCPRCISVTH